MTISKKKLFAFTTTTVAAQAVISSFGKATLAEFGGYINQVELVVDVDDLCVADDRHIEVTSEFPAVASIVSTGFENFFITESVISDAVNISDSEDVIPISLQGTYNGYPDVPTVVVPGLNPVEIGFEFDSPYVDYLTGSKTFEAPVVVTARNDLSFGSSTPNWGDSSPSETIYSDDDVAEYFTITVEHANESPTLEISPSTNVDLGNLSSFTATATVNDEEGNEVDIIFEISDDGFDTVLETAEYNDVDLVPGEDFVQTHEFTDLNNDSYYNWRVTVLETGTDVVAACSGGDYGDPGLNRAAGPLMSSLNAGQIAEVEGYVFIDTNDNNTYDAGETPVPDVDVIVIDSVETQVVESDTTGYFSAVVFPGQVTIEVDMDDPQVPINYVSDGVLTVTAVAGTSVKAELPLTTSLATTGSTLVMVVALPVIALLAVGAKLVGSKKLKV